MQEWTKDGKAALALSGGIDSAILAKYMPRGSTAYTFQCIVPGAEVTNEVPQARKYAEENHLHHEVIEIYWEDFERYAPILMNHKGAPIHSIEVQIYKAALKAKADGFDRLIFGESADANYGGHSMLLSKDWTFGEFISRYSYVIPYQILKNPIMIFEPILKYTSNNNRVNVHEFMRNFYIKESTGSYINACECAEIGVSMPYYHTLLTSPLDYGRIRSGENKYVVRELFQTLYPKWTIPSKTPMPRPMNEWMTNWSGPTRPEFWPRCTDSLTGDQKWLVWALERFLNMIDSEDRNK